MEKLSKLLEKIHLKIGSFSHGIIVDIRPEPQGRGAGGLRKTVYSCTSWTAPASRIGQAIEGRSFCAMAMYW